MHAAGPLLAVLVSKWNASQIIGMLRQMVQISIALTSHRTLLKWGNHWNAAISQHGLAARVADGGSERVVELTFFRGAYAAETA